MSTLKYLKELGEALGYKGDDLRDWLKDQQDKDREERLARREQEKEEREERMKKLEIERERSTIESEERARQHETTLRKMKLEEEETAHRHQIALLEEQAKLHTGTGSVDTSSEVSSSSGRRYPKLPAFDETKDDMDAYLRRFERYATGQKWDRSTWALNLSALLKSKALEVYSRLTPEQSLDYNVLKTALLKRFELTAEGFKKKFRNARPEVGETFGQYSLRLENYFFRWIELSEIDRSFEGLKDFMIRDQMLHVCGKDLTLFLKERVPKSLKEMETMADQFRDARNVPAVTLTARTNAKTESKPLNPSLTSSAGDVVKNAGNSNSTTMRPQRRCYMCNRMGHLAKDCRFQKSAMAVASTPGEDTAQQELSKPFHKKYGKQRKRESEQSQNNDTCGAFTTTTSVWTDSLTSSSCNRLSSSCGTKVSVSAMPTAQGRIEGHIVTVLRDTGCSGIVVRRSLVSDGQLTGNVQTCLLADGTKVEVPVAEVTIDTPYFVGPVKAWCMTNPIYDVIIGNIADTRNPSDPDPEWSVCAVKTRGQIQREQSYQKLRVPEPLASTSPGEFKSMQDKDESLMKARQLADEGSVKQSPSGASTFIWKDGLLYRQRQRRQHLYAACCAQETPRKG